MYTLITENLLPSSFMQNLLDSEAPYRCKTGHLIVKFHKQPSRGVPRKRCSENVLQIYIRTPMPKCDFNKVTLQLYWNHTSAWVFSSKLATYFQKTFSWEHLWTAATEALKLNRTCSDGPAKIMRTLIGITLIWRNDWWKEVATEKR